MPAEGMMRGRNNGDFVVPLIDHSSLVQGSLGDLKKSVQAVIDERIGFLLYRALLHYLMQAGKTILNLKKISDD